MIHPSRYEKLGIRIREESIAPPNDFNLLERERLRRIGGTPLMDDVIPCKINTRVRRDREKKDHARISRIKVKLGTATIVLLEMSALVLGWRCTTVADIENGRTEHPHLTGDRPLETL